MAETTKIEQILLEAKKSFTFRTHLLSDRNIEVEFRPIKVKDQKILIVDSENETQQNKIKALLKVLKSCIIKSPIERLEDLYIQDFIWLVFNLGMKSKGEKIDMIGVCKYCQQKTRNISVDLEKSVNPKYLEPLKDNIIAIGDSIKIFLTFPKVKDIIKIKNVNNPAVDILKDEIDYVEFNGEVIDNISDDYKEKLLGELDSSILKSFETFEKNNPFGVSADVKFECVHCKKENEVKLTEEIFDFF